MTKFQKKMTIIGVIITIIASIIIPIILKLLPDKQVIKTDGVMIEQRIIGPGGGAGEYTIEKGIKITKKTNR